MFPLPAGTLIYFVSRGHWRHTAGGKGGLLSSSWRISVFLHYLAHMVVSSAKWLQGTVFSSIWPPHVFPSSWSGHGSIADSPRKNRTAPSSSHWSPHLLLSLTGTHGKMLHLVDCLMNQKPNCYPVQQRFSYHGFLTSVCPPTRPSSPGPRKIVPVLTVTMAWVPQQLLCLTVGCNHTFYNKVWIPFQVNPYFSILLP